MQVKQITDKQRALEIFCEASMCGDRNASNYSLAEFELGWAAWLGFYTLGDSPTAFCGVRDFGKYGRVFDRYFVYPEFRKPGVAYNHFCQLIIPSLIEACGDKIPFFSIEHATKRGVLETAVASCNEVLPDSAKFHCLPGLYETAANSWQNIAIQVSHTTIDLNRKD